METDKIALQLYTVRGLTAQDMAGTLRQVADLGIRAVELAGYGGMQAAELRAALDALGMRAVSAHVPMTDFEHRLDTVIDELQTLGCGHAIVPSLPNERRGIDQVTDIATAFNRWGLRCEEAGMRFGYHNHDFEFQPGNGQTLFDALTEQTDPGLVSLEVDAGWVDHAGVDTPALIQKHAGRVALLHVKDISREGAPDAPVGTGVVNWPPILAAAREIGVEWYVIEQDHPSDQPLEDVKTSLANLTALLAQV
ncbi:MAG TPA: sugar phosphate isomerase/epimerase [Thermomicrobiales bacterium]|nr:sugar phosphate isomerase/epimerase [Thermomicrobiales bacterium]